MEEVNWKESLDQILLMHEVGIECEINKTIAAFESMNPPQTQAFASCFFDILKNRMIETLRKIQMGYLATMASLTNVNNHTANYPTDSNDVVLISVTTNERSINSTNVSIKKDTTAMEADPVIEKSQTMEENIEAAIAEILRDAQQEITNEEIHNTDEDMVNNNNEMVMNESPDKVDSTTDNVSEANSHDEGPEVNSIEATEATIENHVIHQNEHHHVDLIESKLSDEETISDCSHDDSLNNSQELPFLGFEQSSPVQTKVNQLKRKEVEILKWADNMSKKRKKSNEEAANKDGKEKEVEEKDEKGGKEEDIAKLPPDRSNAENTNENDPEDSTRELIPVLSHPKLTSDDVDHTMPSQIGFYRDNTIPTVQTDSTTPPKSHNIDQAIEPSAVFISRPSPQMVQRMLRQNEYSVHKDGKINAFCFLCEKTATMSHADWKQHMLLHTAEMPYYCTGCRQPQLIKESHGNCSIASVMDIFYDNALKAYICKWCNYIQVHKSKIVMHLKHEHEAIDSNFSRNIERVTLLPDLKPITWSISKDYAYVGEKNRFVCTIANCGADYVNASEFRMHFMQYHSRTKSFNCPHCNEMISKHSRQYITDIFNHFQLHAGYLNECTLCEWVIGNEFELFQHMGRIHYSDNMKYRVSQVQRDGAVEKRECTVWLQCNVCDGRFENGNKAFDHYVKTHKSCYIDFDAIKVVKRTTSDGITSCFTPDEKTSFTFRRSLICKLCDRMPKTKSALIEHFNRDHAMHEIAVRMGKLYVESGKWTSNYEELTEQNLRFDNHMVYYCATCRDVSQTPSLAYVSVPDVHAHWKVAHTNPPNLKPFQFYAVEFVACFYCNHISSFNEVKRHQDEAHPHKPYIITSVLNNKKCALCNYVGNNLAQHTRHEHELVLRLNAFNPNRFTDDTLNKLLAIDIHKKHKCGYCVKVCDVLGEIKQHIVMDHRKQIMYDTFFDNHSVKVIAGCCESVVDLHEFLNHLADSNHKFHSVCSKCKFQTGELLEFVDHQVKIHQITKDGDSLYRRLLQTRFWLSKVIFGNGLLLNKHNLLGTEFDDSKPFATLVDHLLNNARELINARDKHDEWED